MTKAMEVDVWVRGTNNARTESLRGVPENASTWTDSDVRTLLTEMLLALERAQNPGGEPPPVVLRGFSWIVSAAPSSDSGGSRTESKSEPGVLVHLEMKMGTASAGPFSVDAPTLTEMITRVMTVPVTSPTVH